MINFEKLVIENHVVFKNLVWELGKYPLSVIRGRNYDLKIVGENGVGKTLLASSLVTLINDAPPSSVTKKSSKELVFGKSDIKLYVKNEKDSWTLNQFAKGKTVKYKIIKNGEDLEVKDINTARKYITEAIPLLEDHIYSQLYVSSLRPSVLLYGKSQDRLNYFEQIFDLRIYDQLRKAVLKDLQVVNQDFIKSKVLIEQKEDLLPDLKKDVSIRLKHIRKQHKNIIKEYTKAHKSAQQLVEYITLAKQLHSPASLPELEDYRKNIVHKIKIAKFFINMNKDNAIKIAETKKTLSERSKLLESLKTLNPYPKAGIRLARVQQKINKLEAIVRQYNQFETHIEKYKRVSSKYLRVDAPDPQTVQNNLTTYKFKLRQKRKLKAGKPCPLCEQKLPHDHNKNVKNLSKKIKQTKKTLNKAKIVDYVKRVQQKVPKALLKLNIDKIHVTLKKLHNDESYYNGLLDQDTRYQEQKAKLAKLPKPKKANLKLPDVSSHHEKIDKLNKTLYNVDQDIKILNKLGKISCKFNSLKEAKKSLLKHQKVVATLTPKLQKTAHLIESLNKTNSTYNYASEQLAKIEKQLKSLNKSLDERDILEALSKAYSNKGIRILQIQALVDAYVGMLNRFSNKIYSMPVKFYSEVRSNKFHILAERGGKVSDVRTLSGAESRQFLALSSFALCLLMPNHLRTNILIYDEIEAVLSKTAIRKFITSFIPLVCKYVKNVIIITPKTIDDFYVPDAKELTLIRRDNVTSWEK